MNTAETLRLLREALRASPDNLPLRAHYAATLLAHGRLGDAEAAFREALARAPDDVDLRLGLARTFYAQAKTSEALVLLEALMQAPSVPPAARLLHARILLQRSEYPEAIRQYQQAVREDPALEDEALEDALGLEKTKRDEPQSFVEGKLRMLDGDLPSASTVQPERSSVTFADVGGMEALKEEIRLKIIYPMQRPELYAAYGKKVGGGLLMYGPPGCGKTHLARATAGEVDATFLSVGLHDVLDMWIGQSEQNLHRLFEQARDEAPCVLFFDEVDALGASRVDMRRSAGRQLINQFLSELDGIDSQNDGLLVLAATNAPWHLDPALRRPGRFDRILFVPPPDAAARAEILRILLHGKPTTDLQPEKVAKKTEGFSGADLKAVVDVAVEAKLQQALRSGAPEPITTADLVRAAKRLQPTTKEWFATARNHALYANEGGLYDDVLTYTKMKR